MIRTVCVAMAWVIAISSGAIAQAVDGAPASSKPKTLRFAIRVAETGFDPAQISDLYSRNVAAAIFDAPLQWEFLARPVRYRPNTLSELPEISADFKTFTFRIKPGIYFADDPAFKGQRRELVAADYVYSWKRPYDPRWKSPNLYILESAQLLGLNELRQQVLKEKKPFDYDRDVPGLRVLDKYTFQLRTAEPNPRLLMQFADSSVWGAVAREVVEAYGDKIMEHPVGTGPFKLAEWRRASKMVLERNPGFRETIYDEDAPAEDPLAQAAVAKLKGRRLPMIDRVEISVIDENQPRWLAFLNGDFDLLEDVPAEFSDIAIPNNQLAPNLRKHGVQMVRYARADISQTFFNMEDLVVGGYTPEKVALRRAISLSVDIDREIRLVHKGQAVPAQGVIGPGTWGYDAALKTEASGYDPARAQALLDLMGYADRDGDGWREQPDGSPLLLQIATQPDQRSRQLDELWRKSLAAIGLRVEFKPAKWPENSKASAAGKLMMWNYGWSANIPDGDTFLALGVGSGKGQVNRSRFDLPAYNALYAKQAVMPDGPQRQAVMLEAQKLLVAYVPFKIHVHRVYTDLVQPWVIGYHRNVFLREAWRWIDIDLEMQKKARR